MSDLKVGTLTLLPREGAHYFGKDVGNSRRPKAVRVKGWVLDRCGTEEAFAFTAPGVWITSVQEEWRCGSSLPALCQWPQGSPCLPTSLPSACHIKSSLWSKT